MSKKSIGTTFFEDSRINEAKQLLVDAVKEHSSKITKVKPADPELKQSYEQILEEFGSNRGGKLFYNYIGSGIGNGSLVELADGSVKYDFITGIGVHYFGHSHPGVIAAQIDGAITNTTMSGNLQQNIDSPKLFKLILDQANKNGGGFDHMFMTSSGVMAAENALKMAFQKKHPASRVLAFEGCFMGRTMAVAAITDKHVYRDGLPKTLDVDYLPFYDSNDHEGSIKKVVDKLEECFKRYPGQYAAMCMELIQGEGGYWVGHKDFFMAIIDICKKNNVSVIVDEVQTFMRTKELFAFQYFELDKHVDLVNIGKNSQICATIYRADHKPRPGLISQTFTSSGSAINAAYYIINEVANNGYLGEDGKIEKTHKYFSSKLEELSKKLPQKIEGPWGMGAMVGMTLFKGDLAKSKEFTFKLFENGVLSFIAGGNPFTRVRFLVPMGAITNTDIDNVINIIEKTLGEID
ncbi:MAG: aminotransferase class III-fold pyridoxal phosphate-dependent enzyme [Bacteriovoracaceae bacterium]|jgi:acetylornithine aminotransferase|nr:aminotransferase class III-fold pyridoxal phosphate-dependent enzyme [Bacteriovoracaceae bacterium]